MSKKNNIPRRRNDEFNRNKLREGSSERQLFDPRSDNPLAFNKPTTEDDSKNPTTRRDLLLKRPESATNSRRLWNADTNEEAEKSEHTQLETLTATSRSLSCFGTDAENQIPNRRTTTVDQPTDTQPILVEQDLIDTETIWKQKIQLHLSLCEKYLEILNCDLEYAEKKGLETLCWKRAVYSLVDQFRRALQKSSMASKPSGLANMLMEKESVVPVINPGGGMTFIKIEQQQQNQDNQLLIKQTKMILTLFLEYLDLSDSFYKRVTLFLKSVDDETDQDMETYLSQWRRTRKYKWYSCIPVRADIARYRLCYTPDTLDVQVTTDWTKQNAFKEAWKRYFLGIWLMPARGNFYFNLSLLLQQLKPTPGNEFYKLYLSTRSLMVRRNGFLNARESMLVLFENNRKWIHNHLQSTATATTTINTRQKKDANKRLNKPNKNSVGKSLLADKDAIIPALFVRLHGMLFTKIGLDEFASIKACYFDTLFEKNNGKTPGLIIDDSKPATNDSDQLSESHLFWFETIILCLSSLYTYDYANSKLTKLISINSAKIFYPDNNTDEQQQQQFQSLLEDLGESILFTYEIDLTCQIAIELFQRYLDPLLPSPNIPVLPKLPYVSLNYKDNKEFLLGTAATESQPDSQSDSQETVEGDHQAWLVFIEILLHWMVLNGVCIRSPDRVSLWESLIGDIGYDLISHQGKRFNDTHNCKISSSFWPLLLHFLNKLLSELPEEEKYDMVNKHLMQDDNNNNNNEKFSDSEIAFANNISMILGQEPDLPEENYLRGLGWVDEIHGRFLKLEPQVQQTTTTKQGLFDTVMRRKIKILDYGFTLVKHLDDILYYDPVEEIFTVFKQVEERATALDHEINLNQTKQDVDDYLYDEPVTTIAEMDDDVLLSSETECFDEKSEGDDIMTQLKKRREQLQSIVASAEQEERFGYRRLPARAKEREARLNHLRQCIIPGKTILVLDTNCFIGHIDHVRKLLESKKWTIIVPLVVVTELDGLRTNPHRLGLVAQQGIELLQNTLAVKSNKQLLRIQTSHNNFMNDISIRSEQFVFGETDKNLDDLVLSSCLWWIGQQVTKDDKTVPVCLVTGDRNLSVKARARDVEVVPVSAIIQLTPKE
ncbi:hypothetical protein INT48_003082 [Thamnidium elegans]|uniref:PIN domain-containing protein n=1 Tax=Thamnidium elegans TaxID=101142 RepID=A0A8H7STY7_9FUNG|nr:hypothetical protein INT48_003082 [Thamnidium elegans]